MSDQSEAAIAAVETAKYVESFFVTLAAAMRFVLALRVVWLEEESVRLTREAETLRWKAGNAYMLVKGMLRLPTPINSIDGEAVGQTQ